MAGFLFAVAFGMALSAKAFAAGREAPSIMEGSSAFTDAMRGLYHSPKPLVRVLAYCNTMRLPRHAELEKELRALVRSSGMAQTSRTEQYVIKYALASLTRSGPDFTALMEHVALHPFVVANALFVTEEVRVTGSFALAELYPWMANNGLHTRDAWICGIMCADYITGTLTSEARADYTGEFPLEMAFPEYWRYPGEREAYRMIGLSPQEMDRLQSKIPPEEYAWAKEAEMPSMKDSILSEAWGITFDAFLPLLDKDNTSGKDVELIRTVVAPALKWPYHPGGKYERLPGE